MARLNSHQIRASSQKVARKQQRQIARHSIVLVLDNVLDTYNIGSFFRLADALAVQKIYLCGPVVTPPNLKIHRASIGTWKWVPWEHFYSTTDCLHQLKKDGFQLVACEQNRDSVDYRHSQYQFPLALIAGSETNGVGESVLELCDLVVEVPMFGINKSLNVLVATSIVSYAVISQLTWSSLIQFVTTNMPCLSVFFASCKANLAC